jgi:probable HAF family extracellular repeat protein
MKLKSLTCITAITLFTALAIPIRLAAQEQPKGDKTHSRYKLIDLGTFGGPNSFVNGPYPPSLSANGTYAGAAETSTPDPYAPNCQNQDCLVMHAQKWQNGIVTDLGTLPGVNLSSGASWISTNGTIVGLSENGLIDPLLNIPDGRGVLWTKDGQIIDLGTIAGGPQSNAFAAIDRMQVAGISTNTIPDPYSMFGLGYQIRGFVWQNGVKQDLGTLGGPDTVPQGINQRGQIVGTSYTNYTPNPATGIPTVDPFLWENGRMVDLGTLGGTQGRANFVNNLGQVVGNSNLAGDQSSHAFLWDRGSLTDLGTLGGSNSESDWLSDSGLVVGISQLQGDQVHHAFVWNKGVMTDVGTLDLCSNGFTINSRGQVVGTSTDCHGVVKHLFLWEKGSISDLGTLILPGSDIQLLDLLDINDLGEIAATGILPNGNFHACLLVPASEDEIEAAAALPLPATTGSEVVRRVVTTSDDSIFDGRNRMLNRFRRVRGRP